MVRYLALGVLVAGLAVIVWTAVRGDGGDDPAAGPEPAVTGAADSVDGPEPLGTDKRNFHRWQP